MSSEWFYTRYGKEKAGPVSSAVLHALAESGKLQPTDKVWKEGMAHWVPANKIKGLLPSNVSSTELKKTPTATQFSHGTEKEAPGITHRNKKARSSAEPSEIKVRRRKPIFVVLIVTTITLFLGGALGGIVYLKNSNEKPLIVQNRDKNQVSELPDEETKATPSQPPANTKKEGLRKEKKESDETDPNEQEKVEKKDKGVSFPKEQKGEVKENKIDSEKPEKITNKKENSEKALPQKATDPPIPQPPQLPVDFTKVDYTYDFSKIDYKKGPKGQPITERSGEEKEEPEQISAKEKTNSTIPIIRFVEQGFIIEKKLSPEELKDVAQRLEKEFASRHPNANKIYKKNLYKLHAKPIKTKFSKLPRIPLRPDITNFKFVNIEVPQAEVVFDKPEKAILFMVDGKQLPGDLFSLNSKEVEFQPLRSPKLFKYELQRVKAVQTDNDTYINIIQKNIFISLNKALTRVFVEEIILKNHQKGVVCLVSGEQIGGEIYSLYSKDVLFKPFDRFAAKNAPNCEEMRSPPGTFLVRPSNIKYVQTFQDTYIYNQTKNRFISLTSLLVQLNSKEREITDEEIAEGWAELKSGNMPANLELLAGENPIDVNKSFVRHGRRKGEYVSKEELRVAYEDYWFRV